MCARCGRPFFTQYSRQSFCPKCSERNAMRNSRSGSNRIARFIGVDGEGVGRGADHKYSLLSVGDKHLVATPGRRLHYSEIFEHLYSAFLEDQGATYVGFFLGYDFACWLQTLSESRARMLLTAQGIAKRARTKSSGNLKPFPVNVPDGASEYGWELDILGMKRLCLRPGTGRPPGEEKNEHKWLYVCDTGAFFQTSFMNVLKDKKGNLYPGVSEEDYQIIAEGKGKRDKATEVDEEMIRYNVKENQLLAVVLSKLDEAYRSENIVLDKDQWYGPGQAVQKWYRLIGAPTREDNQSVVPLWARKAAQHSYYGGWFEIFRHGIVPGTTYEYDINSAYPAEMVRLPCLLHGTWERGMGVPPAGATLTLCFGEFWGSPLSPIGPLPYRNRLGIVSRPLSTKGWYWLHEIQASEKAGLLSRWTCELWVSYEGCNCTPPFSPMRDLYLKRANLAEGKDSPRGIALKLVYNSGYGKLAQSIGEPKFANPIYASLITAGCRIQILESIATHPSRSAGVVMVATDGVYFDTAHPELELDPTKLGAWSSVAKENLTLFLPGVYWDDATRERITHGGSVKLKSRGVSGVQLSKRIADLDRQWKTFTGMNWPTTVIDIPFSILSPRQALAQNHWERAALVSSQSRVVDANPQTKRVPQAFYVEGKGWHTRPWDQQTTLETHPYGKHFGDTGLLEELGLDDMLTRDSESLLWEIADDLA